MRTASEVRETFSYHPPDEETARAHTLIGDIITDETISVAGMLKPSRERSLFITHMQEGKMWANASLAIHGKASEEQQDAFHDEGDAA